MSRSSPGGPVLNPQKGPRPKTNEERFWSKVTLSDACWEWTGARIYYNHRNGKRYGGYGAFSIHTPGIAGHKSQLAHRFAWEMTHGPIPTGLDVLHHCDNPPCVRPDHLFLGTAKDNLIDMSAKGRSGQATITPDQAREIKTSKESRPVLAERYGVSIRLIKHIRARDSWAWQEDKADAEG